MGRQCDFTDAPSPPTADDLNMLRSRLAELEERLVAGSGTRAGSSSTSTGPGTGPGTGGDSVMSLDESPPSDLSSLSQANPSPPRLPLNAASTGPQWVVPARANRFPAAICLDIDCFKWAGMHIPRPGVDVPQDVYEFLTAPGCGQSDGTGSGAGPSGTSVVQAATNHYFDSVHRWFPIISKKRMTLGIALWEGGPDLAMLFLAMKLVSWSPVGGISTADSGIYVAAKRFLALLESSGTVSLLHLQAMVLVALYEVGHGIYPAAWMSVAMCARYADLIGIPSFKESSLMLGSVATWTEAEERRRVWWAIYILDRYVCLGNKKRFAMPEPDDHLSLPVDDDAWDQGDPARASHVPTTTPLFQPQGTFARLAQASMLVSNVITHARTTVSINRHGNTTNPNQPASDMTYVTNLSDTITSFNTLLQTELLSTPTNPNPTTNPSTYLAALGPRFLAFSAQILLMDLYCCPENQLDGPGPTGTSHTRPQTADERAMQARAVAAIRAAALQVRDLGLDVLEAVLPPAELRRASPLPLDALYAALATLHWLWKEGGDPEAERALEDLKKILSRLAMRWTVATEYLDMIHHHDVTSVMAWRETFS
ncbi:hypothetical protein B0T22DRAFT_81459 [Podospora appendiculata]|uniref:Xylanolytic transcriptional activator regulatory domain-containing protein n=1 Tax=Podospora appendiculata TaxID=314037 RepID=A0AAE0XKE9_9PEZI|nr:hypothetical protein B0T22DRAFT_81459 [Podospora appendiculata]